MTSVPILANSGYRGGRHAVRVKHVHSETPYYSMSFVHTRRRLGMRTRRRRRRIGRERDRVREVGEQE